MRVRHLVPILALASCALDEEPAAPVTQQQEGAIDFIAAHPQLGDPRAFVAEHAELIGLPTDPEVLVGAADDEHVMLVRAIDGVPVFRGELGLHLDRDGGVYRILANEGVGAEAPRNRRVLSPSEVARPFGVATVEPRIMHVGKHDDRHAYQVVAGARGNDAVDIDVQEGNGIDNANSTVPPDGQRPRVQLYRCTFAGPRDSAYDASVARHELGHIVSHRLVGGGPTGCLSTGQAAGLGEGWSDYLAGTLGNDPVIGAYVAVDAAKGVRRAPMDTSPYNYGHYKDGSMTQAHDAGEIWAATLWDLREVLGASKLDRLVVGGMKLTPCNPTMLQARDAILSPSRPVVATRPSRSPSRASAASSHRSARSSRVCPRAAASRAAPRSA